MNLSDDKWTKRYLSLALSVSSWSIDPSRKIGAVAVSEKGQVLATGYNGFPRGMLDKPERYENREVKYKFIVHAEMNCIYNATYNGISLDGATMYVYGLPVCSECAKGIVQVGIKRVIYTLGDNKAEVADIWKESLLHTEQIFSECGIQITRYVL
jgi:dCMP deaminase